jgi:hypothetical protein
METETDKIIKEQLEYLPEDIIALFADPKTNEKISEIGKITQLNDEQLGVLQTETSLLMLGLTNQDEYKNELKNKLAVSEEKLNDILKEIYILIPTDMIEELKIIYAERDEEASYFDPSFSNLPENVQLAITNSNWKEKLYEIAEKYKLTVSQMGILEEITVKVINNEIKPSLYENELASKITILREDISNLVNDVNENVLKRIREVMRDQGIVKEQTKEEIPLPPYKKIITNEQSFIDKNEKIPEPPKENKIEIKNISIPTETPQNIMKDKLSGVTVSDNIVSDYSIPKMSTPETEGKPKAFDPYREAF